MEETTSFSSLLLVVMLAFFVPLVLSRFKRIRIPIVVGEIIAGIIIGRSGLKIVQSHDLVLDLLAEFGFVFLMFLSGMEIDFSNLGAFSNRRNPPDSTKPRWGPLQFGSVSFLITIFLSTLIGFGLVALGLAKNPWMAALILSTTSLGVVLPVLKERGLSSGRYGQTLLVSALIADFATMLLITILVAAISFGLTFDILLVGLLFVAFFLIYRLGNLFFNRLPAIRNIMDELSHATAQIKVRAAFAMMLTFVVLAEVLGAEIILGAFLAGAVVALLRTPEDAELANQLEAIGFGFFIPIFFIMVGVDFNLQAILSSSTSLILAPLLLVVALLVKFIPTLVFRREFSWRETMAAGALLSARLSLIIAASAIGLRLGIISDSMNAVIILVAVTTVTLAPPLFLRLIPEKPRDALPLIVVVGAGPVGLQVAERMQLHREKVVIIDSMPERIERARERGLEAILDHADRPGDELSALLDKAQSLVCAYSDVELNLRVCKSARSVFGIDHVVARVNSPGDIHRFEQLDVITANAAVDQAALIELLTRNPAMYELLTRTDDDKDVFELVVNNPQCEGKSLSELELPGDLLLLALRRDGNLLVPQSNTRIEVGDHLTIVGSCDCIEDVRLILSRMPS